MPPNLPEPDTNVRVLAAGLDVRVIDELTTGLDISAAGHVLAATRRRLPRAVLVLAMHELPADADVLGPSWTAVSLDHRSVS